MSSLPRCVLALTSILSDRKRESDGSRWKLLLRRSQIRGYRFAGGHGLLSLQFLSLVVRRACQRLQPLGTGCCAGHGGSRTCDHVPEDPPQPASALRQVRRAPCDQSTPPWCDPRFSPPPPHPDPPP